MEVFIFWTLFSLAVGIYASNRGRSGFGWFLLSMVLSPLLGLLFVAVSKDLKAEQLQSATVGPSVQTHLKCPACAELVLPEASICKYCRSALTPDPGFHARQQSIARATAREEALNLIYGIAVIGGLIAATALISKCTG